MWSRIVEIVLGIWLLASPIVFGHPPDRLEWWIVDLAAGTLVILAAGLSFFPRMRYAHLVSLVVGAILIGAAYLHFGDPPPASQNEATVGLLLMMFAIIPSRASHPPASWEERRETSVFEAAHGDAHSPHTTMSARAARRVTPR